MTGFAFPALSRPEVSIVIPVFGNWEWLARSLGAILANTDPCYELIVVDNASSDGIPDRLAATTENVRIVRNPKNVGFGLGCNQGAAYARGEFLVFLNTDALVHAGWLPPLLETARANPSIGAVGPRFLNVDGTIQEAGALLFRDATTLAYGNHRPDEPGEFHRPRIVDYASAACLMVRRRVFNEVGGFDPVYAPAYYEDIDLCLTLASHGYLTAYEPRSAVTHINGWSEQHDVDEPVLARNRGFFARRWSGILGSRPAFRREGTRHIVASRDAPLADRLLVVTDCPPEEGSRGAELVGAAARLCPAGHIALLTRVAEPDRRDDLRAIEIAPAKGELERAREWLAERRFHYDVVLSLAPRLGPLGQEVLNTQPQASWILDLDSAAVEQAMRDKAVTGIEAVEAVLVDSEENQQAISTEVTSLRVFRVSGDEIDKQMLEVLIHFGFAASLRTSVRPVGR